MKQQLVKHIIENFTDPYELQKTYRSHPSYSLLTLEDFVPKHIVSAMAKELDNVPLEDCKHFTRAGSCMYEYNDVTKTPVQDAVIDALHSSTFIKWLQEVTDTVDLIPDPHLIGAGYVKSLTGDSLKVHCDFNWNEQIRLHRMLSLVGGGNDDWKEEWGGQLQFYDRERQTVHSKVPVGNGNAVIWSYDNFAFHGYPNPMTNPKNTSRKALRLFYYVSNAKHDDKHPPHRSLYWFDDKEKVPYDKPWTK